MPAHSQLEANANGYYCVVTAVVVGHWFTVCFMRVGIEDWPFCLLSTAGSHGVYRLFCPWNTPGKSTGVGCHSLLQGIFPTQGLHLSCLHCKQTFYRLSYQGSSFVYHFPNLWPLWGKISGELRNMDMLPCKADKCPPNQTKEEEIGILPEKEFRIMTVKMIQNFEN